MQPPTGAGRKPRKMQSGVELDNGERRGKRGTEKESF